MLNFKYLLYITIFLALSKPIQALEWLPEFQTLSEDEEATLENPSQLGTESQSDVLAYTKSVTWEYYWLTHPLALDLSIGSIGAKHFLVENCLKLRKFLTDSFEFRFTYFQEQNFERNSSHYVLELIAWPWQAVGLSLYGEPEHFKRNDDTGIALLLKPTKYHEIRIFNTFVDVTRLRRNDRSDTYIEPYLPYSRGLVGRLWADPESGTQDFFEYALRYDTKTRWIFPDQGYVYDYWKSFAFLLFGKQLTPTVNLYGRIQFDRKFESKTNSNAIRTDRFFIFSSTTLRELGPWQSWELIPGLVYTYRQWETNSGVAIHRDLIPNVTLKMPAFGSDETQDHWEIGIDAQWHRALGPQSLFNIDDEDAVINGRLNLAYEFQFKDQVLIRLQASGDLDKLGTRQSWEGGNGQVKIAF